MRAEIIVACRGELSQNLDVTLGNLAATIGPDDGVHVVHDGRRVGGDDGRARHSQPWPDNRSRGCGQCRHWGIMQSEAKYVVLVDAHMTFPPGWLDAICAHLAAPRRARDITCAHMQSLEYDWQAIPGQRYAGARLVSHAAEPGNQFWPLVAKWATVDAVDGPIAAMMGACYGMRRTWYHKIGAPLGILEAWGQDEEILSLCTHVCGGRVWLMPFEAGHMYGAPHNRGHLSGIEIVEVWANRFAVLDCIPMATATRNDLARWLGKTSVTAPELIRQALERRRPRMDALRDHLAGQPRTVDDLIAAGTIMRATEADTAASVEMRIADQDARRRQTTTPHAPAPPQIVTRAVETCERCGARDPFRQTRGPRHYGPFDVRYARCNHCGHKGQIRTG